MFLVTGNKDITSYYYLSSFYLDHLTTKLTKTQPPSTKILTYFQSIQERHHYTHLSFIIYQIPYNSQSFSTHLHSINSLKKSV